MIKAWTGAIDEGRKGVRGILIRIKYVLDPNDQVMFVDAEIDDGMKKELLLFNASVELREKLVPFLLSFEAE